MLKNSASSLVRDLLSRIEVINPTGASKDQIIKELKEDLQEELKEWRNEK